MKKYQLFFAILLAVISTGEVFGQQRKPNVIIVLTDDQGYGDFSCLGNPVLKTPYLDKFYQESVRFDNFHVSPLCTPSRGELLTGLAALHNKASNVLTGRGLIRRDIVTMPQVFKDNGYRTGIFGKWHLGDTYPDRPMDRGFEKCIWFKGWGLLSEIEYDNDYYRTRFLDSTTMKLSDQYCTDLWFNEAIQWMGDQAARGEPFFTYLSLNAAHGPFLGPKKNTDEYRGKTPDDPTANFFGMIANIDENMERLDQWLEQKNLKENTLVVFMNDNGGTGGVKVYNAGMRGQKASNYDGGHRAACFVRWPAGHLTASRTVHYPATIQDLLPSFVDLLGFERKPRQNFDGISIRRYLLDSTLTDKDRMLVVQYTGENEEGGKIVPKKYDGCVVYNDWRLVGDSELYDLRIDPAQQKNVIADHPKVYKKMHDYYEKWWKKLGPGVAEILPVYIGYDQENPVVLNSNNWSGKGVNTQWGVAQGIGSKRGGMIEVQAAKSGRYRIELSRWPFHLERELVVKGPAKAVGGTPIREGKELPIAMGKLSLNNAVPVSANAAGNATSIRFDVDIKAGRNTIQAWFADKDGQDICGAYYVRVERL